MQPNKSETGKQGTDHGFLETVVCPLLLVPCYLGAVLAPHATDRVQRVPVPARRGVAPSLRPA